MKNTKKNNRNSAKKNIVCIQRQYNCSTNKNWCGLIKSLLFIHDEQQREMPSNCDGNTIQWFITFCDQTLESNETDGKTFNSYII